MFHFGSIPAAGHTMRRRGFAAVAALCGALAFAAGAARAEAPAVTSKGVSVGQVWTRATPAGAKVGAAYLTMAAAGGAADRLLSASSPAAGRVELHTHILDGDIMKMRRVDDIAVGDGKTVLLQPGGMHIMLIDLKEPLKHGDIVKLTLNFEKAGVIAVDAPVEPLGARGPHGLDFQPGLDGKKVEGGPHSHHHH